MTLREWYGCLARYNTAANDRIYSACAKLSDEERRMLRAVSFNSIHGLLNHMLLADRIWMSRFEGGGATTPPLNTVLFEDFKPLRQARAVEDARIVRFFERMDDPFLRTPVKYSNNKGIPYTEEPAIAVGHFFNHATHHRAQIHTLLSQAGAQPPSLDMHRILNP